MNTGRSMYGSESFRGRNRTLLFTEANGSMIKNRDVANTKQHIFHISKNIYRISAGLLPIFKV